ncbi:MAG: polysaccharide pyruvyl transferase family protein [Candidatus Berkelbacteria bacterium]|nr:polysaccharide pyruvyl transferase family protein [Candidatus Berkelbacteria bacterium]
MTIIKTLSKFDNWGDLANGFFLKLVLGKEPTLINYDDESYKKTNSEYFLIIGSILALADEQAVIWGTGFMKYGEKVKGNPRKILAVRGPLSREGLLAQNIDCPAIFGDPILLYPRFYKPDIEKKYALGIIPHYSDVDNPWLKENIDPSVKIIDVKQSGNGFVDDILSCKKIASSSLHGIIVADAYDIPSTWIRFSDADWGNGFKFRDYFLSVGRKDADPLLIEEKINLKEIFNNFSDYKINIDLDKLWENRPNFLR